MAVLSGCTADSTDDDVEEDTSRSGNRQSVVDPPVSIGFNSLPALQLSDTTFVGDHFSGSGACGVCHNGMIDDAGEDVSIESAWATSVMAQSARDPYWRAVAAATLHRFPELSHEVNQVCTRCHAPMANDAAQKDGVELEMFGDTPFSVSYTHLTLPTKA